MELKYFFPNKIFLSSSALPPSLTERWSNQIIPSLFSHLSPTATQTMMIQLVMNGEVRGTLTEDQVSKSGVLANHLPSRQPMEGEEVILDLSSDEDIYPESLDLFIYLTQCGTTGFMRELSLKEIRRFLMFIDLYEVDTDLLQHIQKNVMMYPSLVKVRLIDSMIGVPPVIWTKDVYKQLLVELVEDANLTGLHSSTLDGIMGYMVSNRG